MPLHSSDIVSQEILAGDMLVFVYQLKRTMLPA